VQDVQRNELSGAVVAGVVTGCVLGHSPASAGTGAATRGEEDDVMGRPEIAGAGAEVHRPASPGTEWADRG
jgi:hypothetical protein